MESPLIGLIGLGVLVLCVVSGLPIAFSFVLVGATGLYFVGGVKALSLLATVPWQWATSFTLMAIPLFILMGLFAHQAKISEELYDTFHNWVGHQPGGLAMATTLGCTSFAAISGSSLATAAAMGTVSIPEMNKRGYGRTLMGGSVAAGGTLGIMIPPSIGFIVYGFLVEKSIGKLFMAGILPGLLVSTLFLILIYIWARMRPDLAPRDIAASWKKRFASLRGIWGMVLLFLLIMGGIYGGIFTPTEAAAVGCMGSFIITALRRRLTMKALAQSLVSAIRTTSMVFILFIGGIIFSSFITLSGLSRLMADVVGGLPVPPLAILVGLLATYFLLGMIMDSLALLVMTVPLYLPIYLLLGFDLIWVGVLTVRLVEIGLITPPYGLNLFVIKGVSQEIRVPISLGEIYRGVIPFIIADVVSVVFLIYFPQISLFLPSMMG